MTSRSPLRSCEDVDESVLSYAEIKALCAGDARIKEKMDLDIDVARLRVLKADHSSQRYTLEDNLIKLYPEQIAAVTERIAGIEKDIMIYNENIEKTRTIQETLAPSTDETASDSGKIKAASASASFPPMTILGESYTVREPAAKALMEACKSIKGSKTPLDLGSYLGFSMSLAFNPNLLSATYTLTLKGRISYPVELGTDTFGNIARINNALRALPEQLDKSKNRLEALHSEIREAKELVKMPFEQEAELTQKEARLARLNTELNIGDGCGGLDAELSEQTEIPVIADSDDFSGFRPAANMKARPSILDGIHSYSDDIKPPNALGRDKPATPSI